MRILPGADMQLRNLLGVIVFSIAALACQSVLSQEKPSNTAPKRLKLFFLGDNGHHQPRARFQQLQPVLKGRGIDLTYTDQANDLQPATLAEYDGLILYANIDTISKDQEKALLDYVASGKGFIPLHCASYCFRNSPAVIELVGAQFQSHGTGTFRTIQANQDHPILKGFRSFESWDETYVHTKHNDKDRIILEYRVDGDHKEPWTWVRTQGKGRIFYTAWGHDERTWSHPGFQNLLERGIRWAVGGDVGVVPDYRDAPQMTAKRTDVKPFEYVPAKVPFYPPSRVWGVTGEPFQKMQKPLEPAESMKHYVHPVDFELKLFASEPLIQGKPICMNWDERGRLWIAETVDYPNNKNAEGKGNDRIVILEDTDGDGIADKRTVFVEGLNIPTSIAFSNGGIIILQAPYTLFFKNVDDKAAEKKVLFTGWGIQDTHAGPSNLQYGLDGWFYGAVGYSGFDGTVGGEHLRFSQGFYRFKPDGSKLEFLASTNNNTWGLGFSEEGILFGSTANGNPSVCCPIPNRYYEKVKGWSPTVLPSISGNAPFYPITENVRQVDYHGHFTAAAGHALYTARLYPKEYWNRVAFVCEPTGHLVACFELTPDGASFRSRNAWNLLASDDEWAAPIMAEVGPDSCVWVIDWYNFIVQHNPTPSGYQTGKGNAYETDLRDKKHGRVYRLVPKNKPLPAPVNLKVASPEKLVETLKNDNFFWRRQAQRLLVEGQYDFMMRSFLKLLDDNNVDEIGFNVSAIHALWTLSQIRECNWISRADKVLSHPSPAVRQTAISLSKGQPFNEKNPYGRLKELLTLATANDIYESTGEYLGKLLLNESVLGDRWQRDALIAASANHSKSFLLAVMGENKPIAAAAQNVVSIVAGHYARQGDYFQFGRLLRALSSTDQTIMVPILQAWSRSWPTTTQNLPVRLNDADKKNLLTLIEKVPNEIRSQAIKLGMLWAPEQIEPFARELKIKLEKQLANANSSETDRLNAARDMVSLLPSDEKVVEQIVAAISPRLSSSLTRTMLQLLWETKTSNLASVLLPRLKEFSPVVRAEGIRLLLSRPDSTKQLLDAINQSQLQVTDLTLEQRQALASHPNTEIAAKAKEIIARGGGLPSPDRQKVIDAWLPLTKKIGDAAKGKLVFTQHCSKCHQHSGEGKNIGPDLTGMAVHPKEELIIHILDPSRSVEGNFRVYTVVMQDGKVHSGMLASESRTSVELIDTEGKSTTLQRDDIDQLIVSNKSLMPDGFEKQVSETDFTNLLEFLTQKGKYLPLSLSKVATITTVKGMFFSDEGTSERLIFPDWKPKTFAGVPFQLVDPSGGKVANAVMLNGAFGEKAPRMPKSVTLPCHAPVKTLHFLSGISGWGFPAQEKGTVSMIVRLRYADGQTEDHPLVNGEHFADYIRRVDVPGSQFAFNLRGRQIRYLTVSLKGSEPLAEIELVKGADSTAPVVMAITAELR